LNNCAKVMRSAKPMAPIEENTMTNLSRDQVIADMRGWTDLKAYFEGIRGQINGDLNAAAARVGDTFRQFYVDAENGSDDNAGTSDAPFKTMQKAVNSSVWGGYLLVCLMSDYHMDTQVTFRTGDVCIRSDNASIKRRITFANQISDESTTAPRFAKQVAAGSILLNGITFVSQEMAKHVEGRHMFAAHGLTCATFVNCEFEVPENANLAVFQWAHGVGFIVQASIYPAEMAGMWVQGIAAGTDPSTVRRIAYTNLSSL